MKIYWLGLALVALAAIIIYTQQTVKNTPANTNTSTTTPATSSISPSPKVTATPETKTNLVEPVANFKQRTTLKPFGIHITPKNSPVKPEKFTGYHAGADAEYSDVTDTVPVHAVAGGKVLLARWASGYGGVVAIQHQINNQPVIAIYGHLNPSKLPKVGTEVKAGQPIGELGVGYSYATDGERRHLHLGLYKGTTVSIAGYVSNETELAKWLDPLTVF